MKPHWILIRDNFDANTNIKNNKSVPLIKIPIQIFKPDQMRFFSSGYAVRCAEKLSFSVRSIRFGGYAAAQVFS
jgi:hypothetical protein